MHEICSHCLHVSCLLQFYTKVTEAESWINEKKPLLISHELGRDEDSVQVGAHEMVTTINLSSAEF